MDYNKFGKVFWSNIDDDDDDDEETQAKVNLDEDDFEIEMKEELERRLKNAEKDSGIHYYPEPQPSTSKGEISKEFETKDDNKYDKVYFDSDDDDEDDFKDNRNVKTNDELFYDPKLDEKDQKWVNEMRINYMPESQRKIQAKLKSGEIQPVANSDAVLNCPACFVLVCLDCQRHDTYSNQYRAMFVMNCSVDTSKELTVPLSKSGRKRNKRNFDGEVKPEEDLQEEAFHPVNCDQCKTQLAVYDKEEIYHFFNVVASHT